MEKICTICNKKYTKPPKQRHAWWITSKFCSISCRNKRIVSENTRNKMALKMAGNKKTLGFHPSEETRKKLSEYHKKFGTPWLVGVKQSLEHIEKRVSKMRGENNPLWKGGVSKINGTERHILMGTTKYRLWNKTVRKRDNYKCKIANQDCKGRLEVHHILRWAEYPELRYEVNNGITLCQAHHPRKRAEEKRLSPYFMELVSVSKE